MSLVLLQTLVAIAEGLRKDFDNLFIAAIVIGGYVAIGQWEDELSLQFSEALLIFL